MKRTYQKDSYAENNRDGSGFKQPSSVRLIMQQRQALPIYSVRENIVHIIRQNQTLILLSSTGSGKSTQVPQYLYEAQVNKGKLIGITQPRRVAAITVASRVAREVGCKVGDTVGYAVRFEDATTDSTKIKFMTDGTLFRESLSDQLLKNYNVIILDEAHERTIATDVLFGIVKKAQHIRKVKHLEPLIVVIMSATMDVEHFSEYFNKCPSLYLKGTNFTVNVFQTLDKFHYLESCVSTIFQLHERPKKGDILVFLTGQEEIESMAGTVRKLAKYQNPDQPNPYRLIVYQMYAAMPQTNQMDVFVPTPLNSRKVILATNIAETSITIPGIRYVIDCGKSKVRAYDATTGIDTLKVSWISKAQAWQRTGRAGRLENGECYRTYSKQEFAAMEDNAKPEILRCNILSAALQLLVLGINCRDFDFLDKPPQSSFDAALQELKCLGAIVSVENPALTTLGRKMAKLPLDPRYAKIVLSASEFGCVEEILTIIAVLSGENIFLSNSQKREQLLTAHSKFHAKCGDHITLLKVFNEFKANNGSTTKQWCFGNFLSERNLVHASAVRQQLSDICTKLGVQFNSCGNDPIPVVKCLLTGLYGNIAELQRDNTYLTLSNRARSRIHPSSVLCGRARPAYVLFTELMSTQNNYLRTVSEIEPAWIGEVVPECSILNRISFSGNRVNSSASCYTTNFGDSRST